MFSTFTASTGRANVPFPPARSSPVNGQGVGFPVALSTIAWIAGGALPVNASTASTTAAAVTTTATPVTTFPRWVNAT